MSVECSECERDLRGGHAATCSRSKGWIKCNLPWTYYDGWKDGPKTPNLEKEIGKEFGTTQVKEYRNLMKMLGKAGFGTPEYEKIVKTKEYRAAQRKYRKFSKEVGEWAKNHPAWLDYQVKLKVYDQKMRQKSFCGQDLNKPGTMVEILENKELKHYLIGDINVLGGVCDDCMGFTKDAIVVRYKVLGG